MSLVVDAAVRGALAGAASGVIVLFVAIYLREPRRGILILAISTVVGALFGFIAAAAFCAIGGASLTHSTRRAKGSSD
jgi:membrane-associated PAP2 superfamily phosphatase